MRANLSMRGAAQEIPFSLRVRGLEPRPVFGQTIRSILRSTLGRFGHYIRGVQVWLEDVNGPRGGVDVRCRLDISLARRGQISVSALAIDEYVATAKAGARAREVIARRLKKKLARRRRGLEYLPIG